MNKKVLIITSVVLMAIAGSMAYLLLGPGSEQARQQMTGQQTTPSDQMAESQPSETMTGAYVDYEDGVIAKTSGTKLLFFHAAWCPQCRALEADIKKDGVPSGVTIIKVDYDTSQQLRAKYGVTLQTTIVKVDDKGELIKKFIAYDDPSLDAVIKNLL